ncbi:hypothetical protein GSI_08116 [Ganoderma sinense ZZ0214-1]|uniref:Uncharacterized protein n=1 Tax=Ganoderma sinense ZZ0214-1 TaxID=1077348 RepID=A0A2G8S815_9APHY|nr:hypothetical protein GSI_08116 [Ganoderma sinense ZZ0214-1]
MLSSRPISFNGDVDVQQSILNAKTPGRKALKGRSVLQENALHNGAKTVLSKKNILQTPFRPGTAHGKKPLVSISVTRPLMDKTPFPNRIAAANFGGAGPAGKTPGATKLSKLALLVSEPPHHQHESLSPDVAPLLRPSSARKSLRGRLSGASFKTPLTKGNYWDVSPGDVDGIGGVAEDAKQETDMEVAVEVVDDEDDEIEYMPPTAIELPYEPAFAIPDYKAMGQALFALGHGGLVDDAADVYYAMDIEQQVDMKQLCADAGFTSASDLRDASGLELPELGACCLRDLPEAASLDLVIVAEDDSPFARKPKGTPRLAPVPSSQAERRPPTSKSASSIPLTRTSSTRASSRTQPAVAPARPATTTPPIQSRPVSTSTSSSRLPQPTIVVAPGQTRTSALRAAKAAAAATASASASSGSGLPAPKTKANAVLAAGQAARRPVASISSNTNATGVPAAGTKPKTQAQAPTHAHAHAHAQAKVQVQAQARPITIVRSVTSGAISAKAKASSNGRGDAMGTGTGTGVSAGTRPGTVTATAGTSTRASAGLRARSATVNASLPGRPASGVKGARGPGTGGKAHRDGDRDGEGDGDGDELATALEKAIGDAYANGRLGASASASGGSEDFVFDV